MYQGRKNKILISIIALLILFIVCYGFLVTDPYYGHIFLILCVYSVLASALRFVMLFGEINLAHASFFGIGAYASAFLTIQFKLPFILALLVSGIITALISILFGLIAFRLKEEYFLLLTFALALMVVLFFQHYWKELFGGVNGISGIPVPMNNYHGFVAIISIILLLGFYLLERSDFGKILKAIESSDDLAKSIGVNLVKYKILALSAASFAAGLSGSMFAHFNNVITPHDFSFHFSIILLSFVIIGGKKVFFGPIAGAVLLTLIVEFIRSLGPYEPLVYGMAIILTMIFLPNGLIGSFPKLSSLKLPETKKREEFRS